jgi:hypothetical protein
MGMGLLEQCDEWCGIITHQGCQHGWVADMEPIGTAQVWHDMRQIELGGGAREVPKRAIVATGRHNHRIRRRLAGVNGQAIYEMRVTGSELLYDGIPHEIGATQPY